MRVQISDLKLQYLLLLDRPGILLAGRSFFCTAGDPPAGVGATRSHILTLDIGLSGILPWLKDWWQPPS
jgi:hypothetical protein